MRPRPVFARIYAKVAEHRGRHQPDLRFPLDEVVKGVEDAYALILEYHALTRIP
jgi:hypothetical protein